MVQEATTQPEGKKEGGSLLQLAAIVEESHDAIIGKTLDGIITSWNGGATKMFGYLPEEVIGKPMTNLFPPELKDELPRLLEKVRRGEIIADYDSIWLRKDGTRADVEFSISPVHTEGSAIIGASLVGRDITARKTAEESMRQTQLIVENSYDAIIGETLDSIITGWNGGAAKMFGYTAQESIGKNISFLAPPEMQDEMPKLLERVKAGEVIADYDTVRVRKDGSRIDIALSISPIQTEDGTIIGASLVKRDITLSKAAEESMRQTQLIVENSYDAIIGETLDAIITGWNGGAAKMFGYTAQESIGKNISFLAPPEMQDEMPKLLERIKAGEVIADYDTVRVRKDGSRIAVALSISPIKTEDGAIIGASLVKRDITLRKGAEESMRQIQLIVEESHDAIIGKTLDGIITSWNGGAVKMFGYSPSEVIGKPMTNLFTPELKDELPRLLEKVRRGEVIADYDSIWLREDGTQANVEFSISPVHTEDGTIIGASLVGRDITLRKKSEESLRQTQLIVENSYDAIIGETLDGIITTWNRGAVKMFGYSPEEAIGKPVIFLLPLEIQNEVSTLLNKIKEGEAIADYDSVRVRKDGVQIDIALSISPIKTEDGTIIGASIVERDITARKKSDRQIKELNEVRSKFISIMSHQLRTPLTVVNWNLESVLDGDFGKLDDTVQKFLLATHKSSVEITHRIHDLLTAIDIEEGRIVFEKDEVALDSIAAAVMNEITKRSELKNIACEYIAPEGDLPTIEGDGEKIRAAINKMMENAIIYTKENGKIIARLERKGDKVRFEVKDSGVGIPTPEQHRVFTRFFRASNATVMQPDSFGLGLFIAKSFIEQHEGTIGFESKEGEGSTFWFEIPMKLAHS
ncbi:TPA: hypothetical protein DDX30_00075 [Candidatus Wolfebacteria bacterium]|nr:hypothetical protein [Candidatus Wolfebacteria bacterium]